MAESIYLIMGIIAGAGAASVYFLKKQQALAAEKIRLEAQIAARAEKDAEIAAIEKNFSDHFENLAHKILQQNVDTFKKDSQENLGQLLNPLKEKLQEFQKKVDESFGQQAKEQYSLKNEIARIVMANEKITLQAESLTRALKGDVKTQGNWGEVMLEKILEDSGLRKGEDYVPQGADLGLKAGDGSHQKPDIVVKLPENKHIIIDAKVSLTHYERWCAAQDETERAAALKDYTASVRAHVAGLAQRRYQDSGLGTPDFVLMFLPVESAWALALQNDPDLHASAWDKKVVIVCPSTLFATLKTIASVWRIETQNRNTLEIARQGGLLYDKVAAFVEDMEQVGTRLKQAQDAHEAALNKLSKGTGNILRRTENLKALGVKTAKSIDPALLEDNGEETDKPLKVVQKP